MLLKIKRYKYKNIFNNSKLRKLIFQNWKFIHWKFPLTSEK